MQGRKCYFVAVFLAVVCAIGCARPPVDGHLTPKLEAERVGKIAIAQFDANRDGKLDVNELDKCPGLKAVLSRLDPAGQGYVTADAIAKRIKQWQASRLGGMQVTCIVMHNDKPLEGAQVRFVPEKFLGEMMGIASGKTDQKGITTISIFRFEPSDPPCVPPGFYRVEITKPGVNIPEKYNTETIFGVEVAPDVENIKNDFNFKMRFKFNMLF